MARAFVLVALFWASIAHAEFSIEFATGVHHTDDANLLLVDFTRSARPLFGQSSYWQYNAGAWSGSRRAYIIGIARGLQWDKRNWHFRLSTGVSLISNTSDMLSTAFQFYEQVMAQRRVGNHGVALSYRHWSNANIKRPNYGMDFLGVQVDINW